jgi:hypothetical protein
LQEEKEFENKGKIDENETNKLISNIMEILKKDQTFVQQSEKEGLHVK